MKFGEICQCDITPALASIWVQQLSDIPPELLDRACDRLAKMWTYSYLPKPGSVRAQVEQADSKGLQLEAEQRWQHYLTWLRDWFVPDLGVMQGAPALLPAVEHASRAAGGHHWIERCPEAELQWARRRFVEDYVLLHETHQVEHLLTSGEAKDILAQLSKPPERKRLVAPENEQPQATGPEPSEEEVSAGFAAVREKLAVRPAVMHQALSQEEGDRRVADLKRQADVVLDQKGRAELKKLRRLAKKGQLDDYLCERTVRGSSARTAGSPARRSRRGVVSESEAMREIVQEALRDGLRDLLAELGDRRDAGWR